MTKDDISSLAHSKFLGVMQITTLVTALIYYLTI